MGCGQSKIGSLYSRSKAKHKKALQPPATSAPGAGGAGAGEDDGGGDADGEGGSSSTPASPSASAEAEARRKALANRVRQVLSSGPLLAQAEVSSSQLDFFRMLDERIENGPDYASGSDDEVLSVPERQSSLPEDEQSCRLELQSLASQQETEYGRQEKVADGAGKRLDRVTSTPANEGIKSPVMNGELRRWDPPTSQVTGSRPGNGLGSSPSRASPKAKTVTPRSNT